MTDSYYYTLVRTMDPFEEVTEWGEIEIVVADRNLSHPLPTSQCTAHVIIEQRDHAPTISSIQLPWEEQGVNYPEYAEFFLDLLTRIGRQNLLEIRDRAIRFYNHKRNGRPNLGMTLGTHSTMTTFVLQMFGFRDNGDFS